MPSTRCHLQPLDDLQGVSRRVPSSLDDRPTYTRALRMGGRGCRPKNAVVLRICRVQLPGKAKMTPPPLLRRVQAGVDPLCKEQDGWPLSEQRWCPSGDAAHGVSHGVSPDLSVPRTPKLPCPLSLKPLSAPQGKIVHGPLKFGIYEVECCTAGQFFREYPKVVAFGSLLLEGAGAGKRDFAGGGGGKGTECVWAPAG